MCPSSAPSVNLGVASHTLFSFAMPLHYGFLVHDESKPRATLRTLRFEGISASWFDLVWNSVQKRDGSAQRLRILLKRELGLRSLPETYSELSEAARAVMFAAHVAYFRFAHAFPGGPRTSLIETLTARLQGEEVVEGEWYALDLDLGRRSASLGQPLEEDEVLWVGMSASASAPRPVRSRRLRRLTRLRSENLALHQVLQALYLPQADPKRRMAVASPLPDDETKAPSTLPHVTTQAPGSLAPYSPVTLGLHAVGAASNAVLWDQESRAVAYLDYGTPSAPNRDTFPPTPDPCICEDAVVVLSHWDYDHYGMAERNPGAYRRRWIAPQQPFGSVSAHSLYASILSEAPNGGALYLWPMGTPANAYLPTRFGHLMRAWGRPVNEDNLVVYARVETAPGVVGVSGLPDGLDLPRRIPPTPVPLGGLTLVRPFGPAAGPAMFLAPFPGPPPCMGSEAYVLLSGDAGLDHVPMLTVFAPLLAGLVAPHHGAGGWLRRRGARAAIPRAPLGAGGKIAFSYGTRSSPSRGHCYGHPHATATGAYGMAGWGAPDPTAPGVPFTRLNTAPDDYRSADPYNPLRLGPGSSPVDARTAGHMNADVAIGRATAGGPLQATWLPAPVPPTGPLGFERTCIICGAPRYYAC